MNTKLCMNYIFILAILSIVMSCISVNAVTIADDTGDVWYKSLSNGWLWTSKNNTDHANIDIMSIDYILNESFLTIEMTLKERIDESKNVGYELYYGNFNGRPYYLARYLTLTYSGLGRYYYIGDQVEDKGFLSNPISDDGMVFSVTFEIDNIDSSFEIWGQAYENSDDNTEQWVDFVPLKFEPELGDDDNDTVDGDDGNNTNGNETVDNTTGNNGVEGTPGFEIIILISAIVFIIFKKQKRNK